MRIHAIRISAVMLTTAVLAACDTAPEGVDADSGVQEALSGSSAVVPGTTPLEAVMAAVEALGGADRINGIRSITLMGYAHHAYQHGGGNITALPDAPQKYIAANDLQRIYDLENDRYYEQERRNNLFPFANYRGHSFALRRVVLDGDVGFNINPANETGRIGDTRELRMWMHTNPVVALRAALDPANTLDNRREEDGLTLVDITLAEGDKLTIAVRPPSNQPAWIRWTAPQVNLGEIELTTRFYGYLPYDGVSLPLGYTTSIDWRDIELFKMWVDGYRIDGEIPDLAAPADLPAMAGGGGPNAQPAQVQALRPGVWRIGGTAVVEFTDHLTLFEAGGGPDRIREAVRLANTIVPGKQATRLVQSHHHFDHSAGLRQAVAEGLTIVTRRDNCQIFAEMTSRPAPNFPDDLARSGRTLNCVPVDDSMVLEDAAQRLELYHTINNNHTADNLFGYLPAHKMIIEADVASADTDLQWWGDSWIDNVRYRNLDVELNLPIHDRDGRGVWTFQETLDFVQPGIEQVKQFCAKHEAAGNYHVACPPFLR